MDKYAIAAFIVCWIEGFICYFIGYMVGITHGKRTITHECVNDKEQTMIQIDMDMPIRCEDCPMELSDEYELSHECVLLYKGYTNKVRTFGRLAECPLKGADDDL